MTCPQVSSLVTVSRRRSPRLPRAPAEIYTSLPFRSREGAAGVTSRLEGRELHPCGLAKVTLECESGYQVPILVCVWGGVRALHSNKMLGKGWAHKTQERG